MSFADVKGIRTFYREYGNAKDGDVLFIHGLGSSSIVWRDIPDALSVGYHAIAIDLVGFGMSDNLRNLAIIQSKDLANLLQIFSK